MFSFFKKKLKINLMSVIIVVLLINYFFIISMYSSIIEEDFSYKIEHFNSQYINNVHSKMNEIENQVQLFIRKYADVLSLNERKPEIISALKKVKNYTYGINSAFIVGGRIDYYDGTFYNFISEDRFKEKYIKNPVVGWTTYESSKGELSVFYLQPINDLNENIVVSINPEIFRSWDTNNTFYNVLLTSVSFINDNSSIVDNNSVFTANNNDITFKKTEYRLFSKKISDDIILDSYVSSRTLKRQLYKYYLYMAFIIIFFITVAVLFLHFMTERIEKICNKIFNKFKDFPNEIKGGDLYV